MICDELHIEADCEVQAIVTTKEMCISRKGSFIGERKKRGQAAVDSAVESLTPDVEAIDSPPKKVVLNLE